MKPITRFVTLILLSSFLLAACQPSPQIVEVTIQHDTPTSNTPTVQSEAAAQISVRLQGLDFDTFLEASWREWYLRTPESIIELGLTPFYGEQTNLNNISDSYLRENYEVAAAILQLLKTYDREALTPEQQISYDIYAWYWQDKLDEQPYLYYDYPVTFFTITSIPDTTIYFFTDLLPLQTADNARNYVHLLHQVKAKMEQVLEGLNLREQAGIVPPRFSSQWALGSSLGSSVTGTPFYTTLRDGLDQIGGLSDAEKQALLEEARNVIQDEILPAYDAVYNDVQHLADIGSNDVGVGQFAGGNDYYAYLLRHYTTTEMTAEEIYTLGMQELERIHKEMYSVAAGLGYPEGLSIPDLYDRVAKDSGIIRGDKVLQTYTELIQGAEARLSEAFDTLPKAKVIVVPDQYGGFYQPGSYDGSRPGAFYAAVNSNGEPYYAMPTLAYHETVPGHHLQIALAAEMNLPAFRKILTFNAYTEGWALYAERLAYELGWYQDDPQGNLGRLQAEAFRAARLVVDTGMHARGWTFEQAQAFFTENTGFEPGDSIDPQGQIARYVVWPGQSTSYYIGFLKIMELRQKAMDALGEQFDLKEFHHIVLGNGSMPLEVLEKVVDNWIESKTQSSGNLNESEKRSLASLEKVNDYPVYILHAYDTPASTANRATGTTRSPSWGCSLFAAWSNSGQALLGRNFDWDYSPMLVLYNHPAVGYDSISIVDLAYLVDSSQAQNLLDLPLEQRAALLSAPFIPFDGMNEKGLAIGMAAVPEQPLPNDPARQTIGSLGVMRVVLDQAATVDEAVAILGNYNIDFEGGPPLHYLIAERSGKAAVVEFYQGEMRVIPNTSAWHLMTNFLLSQAGSDPRGECLRYDTLQSALSAANGQVEARQAMQMLESVAQSSTQWSVVYGLDSGKVQIVPGGEWGQELTLKFP